ncbi:RNA chaperone Hfq [Cupriavidus basilensis]|uniref:RNA chaperone Hfq n=1 Tax=Cupriavidus basilensis TaxID=68895 RepID=A0ABT6ALD3_9BURK|nr:RNA chaperone Hfq [Cupriavidus basilensis]MDF3833274.1 RNA chaperone Hfq [Cupriavidus basilensis]
MQHVALGPQNWLLNVARKERRRVKVYVVSGVGLAGSINSFDNFVVLLNTTRGLQAIYKHAIASVQLDDLGCLASSESDPKAPAVAVRKCRPIRD